MGRPRIHPPRKPIDPAKLSEIRRAAGIAGAKARAAKSPNKGRKPYVINVRPETGDRLKVYAQKANKTLTTAATELIDDGLARVHGTDE